MNNLLQLILTLTVVFFLAGCIEDQQEIGPEAINNDSGPGIGGTAIADILVDKDGYRGREVTVSGKVMPGLAFEFISEQPYRIIQEETLLWVITDDVAPREGAFVTVRGRIAAPYQIKGRSYELVLIEEERL
ncbi:MAG TPA: hypothetical protein ENO11_05575 [Desulfobacteraceae bacterium]|nr:hypothetical protein [Desulfobacteraceae bacterium]